MTYIKIGAPYPSAILIADTAASHKVLLFDHLNGVDINNHNQLLDELDNIAQERNIKLEIAIVYHRTSMMQTYKNLSIKYAPQYLAKDLLESLHGYTCHPPLIYKNFICSFNGSDHVGRKLLVSILEKFKYFNPGYCSKNFSYSVDILDGHIHDYVGFQNQFYNKFFISDNSEEFFQSVNSFGHVRFEHNKNIYNLESKLTESFLHIVSETMPTSYAPVLSEKAIYSIVTRGLFLAYAQPGWHNHLEKYWGFKLYTKLFDYRFDSIQNPVERLVELMTMISKFSKLATTEWHDLYLIEQETIEHNYNHYFSGNYLDYLQQHEN